MSNFPGFLPIVALAGVGVLYFQEKRLEREDEKAYKAWIRLNPGASSFHGWMTASKRARRERAKLKRQVEGATKTLRRVGEMADILEAFTKLGRLLAEPDVDLEVKRAICEHWTGKLADVLEIGHAGKPRGGMEMRVIFKHELDELLAAKKELEHLKVKEQDDAIR